MGKNPSPRQPLACVFRSMGRNGAEFHSSSRKTRAVRDPMNAHTPEDLPQEGEPERPSKSERKRAAHAAQDLGEALIRLRDPELEALGLPERLTEAVREARHIRSRAAGARQRQ